MPIKYTYKNPAFGKVPAKQWTVELPEIGEVFRESSYSGQPGKYVVYQMTPEGIKLYGEPYTPKGAKPGEKEFRRWFWDEKTGKLYQAGIYNPFIKTSKTLSGLKAYNIADVQKAVQKGVYQGVQPPPSQKYTEAQLKGEVPKQAPPMEITGLNEQFISLYGRNPKENEFLSSGGKMYIFKGGRWTEYGETQTLAGPSELGKELPFPTTQAQMEEYKAKHTFKEGKWYEGKEAGQKPPIEQPGTPESISGVGAGGEEPETPSVPTTSINLDELITGNFDTDDLINIFSTGISQADIDKLLDENQKLRQQFLNSLNPTQEEIDLKTKLADLRNEIEAEKLAYRKGVADIQQELVSTRVMAGKEQALYTQTQLRLQTLAMQESNLLTRLGLEQEAREASQKVLATTLEFTEADINRLQRMENTIYQRKMDMFNMMSQLSLRAQNTLNIILKGLTGLDAGDLDNESITKLQSLTKTAGIPWSVIQQVLKVQKDEYLYQQYMNELDRRLTEQDLLREGGEGGIGATGIAPVEDSNTGKTYDLGTVAGLKEYKEDHPDITYSDMNAWLDVNTDFDKTTREQILKEAGYVSPGEEKVEEYLNPDYIKEQFGSRLNTKKVLRAAGVASFWKTQASEYQDLIDKLMKLVNNYRTAGYNDDEIRDVILKKIESWEK